MTQIPTAGDVCLAPAPRCAFSYAACARAHAIDVASTLLLFFGASLAAGRVWRFPFDDEIYTLSTIERYSALPLLTAFPAHQDVHPPLSYFLFYALRQLGLDDPAMRLCSLAMTAIALGLFQVLALTWLAQRNQATAAPATRLIAVLLFGLTPLAVSQGDALRWYPLFTVLIALFATLYLACRSDAAKLCSGAILGLAASTNLLAGLMVPPLMVYRYALQRQFRWSFELSYWLLAAFGAGLGFYSAYWLFSHRLGLVHSQFGSVVWALPTDMLGFFGGDALGPSKAWIVIPAAVISAVAIFSAIDRKEPGNPAHLLLLMLGATALMALAGFAKPRSFLYLSPMVAALLTLFFDRQLRAGHDGRALALLALMLTASVGAIANINFGTHPYKRNTAIPYRTILDFVGSNEQAGTLVISTDPVVPWLLRQFDGDRCAEYFLQVTRCLAAGRRYDSIFVITGHSDKSANAAMMRKFNDLVTAATAGRSKIATLHAGQDQDAALKSRLTGVPLDETILTVDYYR